MNHLSTVVVLVCVAVLGCCALCAVSHGFNLFSRVWRVPNVVAQHAAVKTAKTACCCVVHCSSVFSCCVRRLEMSCLLVACLRRAGCVAAACCYIPLLKEEEWRRAREALRERETGSARQPIDPRVIVPAVSGTSL